MSIVPCQFSIVHCPLSLINYPLSLVHCQFFKLPGPVSAHKKLLKDLYIIFVRTHVEEV